MFQEAIGNSGDDAASAAPPKQSAQLHGVEEEEERVRTESERGNGWPRQETLALIKIRSDMDFAFRDASAKGPLWDEVARKLGELGYHRSGKKCREKFENIYKYHKRTKQGRASKADGKTYRFFDQLEALKPNNPIPPPPTTTVTPVSADFPNMSSSTDTTSSDEEEPTEVRRKRKRKWKDFFGRLMKEVIHKQEELQMKFLDEIEKRDRERVAREEAWRMEEMAKMNREHDLLVHERSVATAKDAAVVTFLQKITQQNPINANADPKLILQQQLHENLQPVKQQPAAPQQHQLELPSAAVMKNLDINSGGEKLAPSPSRWPKAQVYALINLRTRLDIKYQDSSPKGPLWEEISAEMMKLGYNRSAKRCKEKWENINKYYKKVKESNKKRPEDSKTCPYFHQLDALYRERGNNNHLRLPDQMEPIMAEPEQQWPLLMPHHQSTIHQNYENVDQNNEDDYDDEHEDEEDEGGDYEIVPNNNSSSMAAVIVTET